PRDAGGERPRLLTPGAGRGTGCTRDALATGARRDRHRFPGVVHDLLDPGLRARRAAAGRRAVVGAALARVQPRPRVPGDPRREGGGSPARRRMNGGGHSHPTRSLFPKVPPDAVWPWPMTTNA